MDKIIDTPVHWVTSGGGILAFGSGKQVDFALEEYPSAVVSSLSFDHTVSEGLVWGRYAFLSQGGLGLRILDVEDPSNPVDLGVYALSGSAFHLASWGNFLFIGNDSDGVRVLEIYPSEQESIPNIFQTILVDRGFIHVGRPITAITVSTNGKAYVATENEVGVYDILDPSKPMEVDRFSINLPVRSMGANGNDLYLAAGDEGLHIVDLSVPGKASTLTTHRIPSESLYLTGRMVYLAAGTDGLYALQAGPNAPATFHIQATHFQFMPHTVHIYTGDTVKWIWMAQRGSKPSEISLSPDDNGGSGINVAGAFSHIFHTPGTFRYKCIPSCSIGKAGTINVVESLSGVNISVTPTSVDFGNISVGQSSDQTIMITNLSSSTATLNGSVYSPSAPFSVVSGIGNFSLFPGQSESVTVRFQPTAAGTFSGTLKITHYATNQSSPTNVPLGGTGVVGSVNISIAPTSVSFGNVASGQTSDQTITIRNQTSSTRTLIGSVGSLTAPFSVVSGGGAFTLLPGQSISVTVRFSPTAAGSFSGTLPITHNAGNQSSPTNVLLSGMGVTLPPATINVSITPTSVGFGGVTLEQISDRTITITNLTSSTGTLTGNVGSLSAPFSIVSGGGVFSLTPGQSKSVVVRFSPTAAGSFSGTLPITHNAGNQSSPTNVFLSGMGVTLPPGTIDVSITPTSVGFGDVTLGQTSDRTITITNLTSSTETLTGNVGSLSAPFSIVSGGGVFTLTPGQSKSVTVRFSPAAAGAASGDLLITHNATNHSSPTDVSLSGTGVEPSGPNVVITSISGPSTGKPGGRISIQNTVTNQGNQRASRVTVNFVLSTDTTIDAGDTFIGKRSIMSLGPGASSGPVSTMVTIPRTVAPGSYFTGAMAGSSTNFDPTGIIICLSLSKPTLLSPKNRGTNNETTPTLDWSAVKGATSYEVQVATDSKFTDVVASMADLSKTQWTVAPALSADTKYFWRVRTANACGLGPWSWTWSFKTL